MPDLIAGSVKINVAEFISALITYETFAEFCMGRSTTLELDNFAAKVWVDTARCTKGPYDRCAKGVHLHILEKNIKIKTSWIPSADNVVADTCSRRTFSWQSKGHVHIVAGYRFRRI